MVLREHEAGAKAADLAHKHGISEATLYNWKAKYGGLDELEALGGSIESESARFGNRLVQADRRSAAMSRGDRAYWSCRRH